MTVPCPSGKRQYASKQDANTKLEELQGTLGRREKEVYYCADCGSWHLKSGKESTHQRWKRERREGKISRVARALRNQKEKSK